MIALNRPPQPVEYATIDVTALTQKFKTDGASVWKFTWLTAALGAMSGNKCAYCETSLGAASVYLEVEHFQCKDRHKDDVLTWTNLLPSCKRCNGTKGTYDVTVDPPIINPAIDDPRVHLRFQNYQYVERSQLGHSTLSVLQFNFDEKLMGNRFRIGLDAANALRETVDLLPQQIVAVDAELVRRVRNRFRRVLKKGSRDQAYAATVASILVADAGLNRVKQFLTNADGWTQELSDLENEIRSIALI